ncbi:MAG: hypothetical protein HY074_20930, partial [Deltaproteobacteria bacterium]|nr:hypothetical protein [Deltaproteobacteria bacterium]
LDDIVDQDFSTTSLLRGLKDKFGDKNELFVTFARKDGAELSVAEVCAIRKWLGTQVRDNNELARMFSAFSIRQASWRHGEAWFPSVLSPDCDAAAAGPAAVAELSAQWGRLASSPWAGIVTPAASGAGVGIHDMAVDFYLRDNSTNLKFGTFDPVVVTQMMADFERQVGVAFPPLQAHWTGMAAFQYYVNNGFQNLFVLNAVILLVLMLLFRLLYGTFRSALLLITTLVFAGIFLHGLMGALDFPLDILSNNLFLLVVVSTIEDFIFVSYLQLRGELHWRAIFRGLLVPSFFTSLSTLIGFASLGVSELSIIRRFGVMAGLGALIEWGMVFLVLPAFVQEFPGFRNWVVPRRAVFSGLTRMLSNWVIRPRLARVLLVIYPLAIIFAFHLRIADSPERTFPPGHPFRATFDYMSQTRETKAIVSLVFRRYNDVAGNQRILMTVARTSNVARIEDPYRVEQFMLANVPDRVRPALLRQLREAQGFRRYVATTGEGRAILFLRDSEIGALNRLRGMVAQLCAEGQCWLAGTPISYAEFGDRIRSTLLESLIISLALVGGIIVFLALQLGQPGIPALLLSAFWGSAAMCAAVGLLQIPISFITCIFAATLVGLAGDNTIQFIFSARRGRLALGVQRLGGASVQVAFCMVGIALCFLSSYFQPPRELGLLLTCGFLATLAGDFWLFKGLLATDKESP